MAFQNKDGLLDRGSREVMGKEGEKTKRGTVPMFVATRNVIRLRAACSAFVATVTGHLLHGQRTGPRRRRHDLINDSTRHPGGHWSTQSARRSEAFSSLPGLSGGQALNTNLTGNANSY